jgi:colanic acid/amylovoran biosynthesis glycosyltransferase
LKPFYKSTAFSGKGPYDIVHCHFGPNGQLGLYLRDIGVVNGKVITSFHGYDIGQHIQAHGLLAYQDVFNRCEVITANSYFTKNKLKALGCDENKIVRIPMGLNLKKFKFQEKKIGQDEEIRILTVARLVEKKGLEYSIQALRRVVKEYPRIKYFIVGDGPLRDYLEERAVQFGLGNKINFLGWQSDREIVDLFAKCHIFILPSITTTDGDHEGQGLVLQEAQASGLPVICTRHNGFPESIIDGTSGYLVSEKDECGISEKLLYLIENQNKWPEMGAAGRKFVQENFDIDKLNDQLMVTYRGKN